MSRFELALDNEERATLALGAMDALDDLLSNLVPNTALNAENLGCLLRVIKRSVRDAIVLPCDTPGQRSSNDDD